jgi:hypothetical protein
MANPEHLEILEQGVEVWNKWREENPEMEPDIAGADFEGENLNGVNFCFAYHPKRGFVGYSDLEGINLRNAELRNANFHDARLYAADLSGANCENADFTHANLTLAYLIGTNFSHAKLGYADLREANLDGADFSFVRLNASVFGENDFSKVKGLGTVEHLAPSTIGIDVIYYSKGKIPDIFLRGCGIPESFIVQIPALVASVAPIQFYKCFISFTEADDAFSERLYNDLQAEGVRCWRWKEDAKWGKTLMSSIDQAVRLYDKLIIVCSEQSLESPAVIREIERALQKEDDLARQDKEGEVLFPIRLDDYIFTGWNHHRKADVIAKNVGDFRKWKDHDSYQKSLDRLLRDLKAEEKIV